MRFSHGSRFVRAQLSALAGSMVMAACSTVTQGTTQRVAISTPGAEATSCRITGANGVNMTVNPPAIVRLPKSKDDLQVTCMAANQAPVTRTFKSSYSNWSYVQLPIGYVTDAATGAMWAYPAKFEVPMGEGRTAPKPQT
jgi:hypothetical protein